MEESSSPSVPGTLPAGLTPGAVARFAENVQEAALPAVWTRGVSLARTSTPIFDDEREKGEFRFRCPLSDRPVSPRVTLWVTDGDWHCDCGDRNDPCPHIVAVVAALKQGRVQSPARTGTSTGNIRTIEYRLFTPQAGTADPGVRLERWILSSSSPPQPLGRDSVVNRIAGIQSGRIPEAPLQATQADLLIDQALTQIQAVPERPVDGRYWPRILRGLEDCTQVLLDGSPVKASARTLHQELVLTDSPHSEGFCFHTETLLEKARVLAFGLCLKDGGEGIPGTLYSVRELELTEKERQALRLGSAIPHSQRFWLAAELLPSLEAKLALRVETSRLPVALKVKPQPRLSLERRPDGALAVLASVVYFDPEKDEALAILQDDGSLLQLATRRIPIRDRASEHTVGRRLQNELFVRPGKVTEFRGADAAAFMKRVEAGVFSVSGSAAQDFRAPVSLQARLSLDEREPFLRFAVSGASGDSEPLPEATSSAVLRAWQAGERFFQLGDGSWAQLPIDWLSRFGEKAARLLAAREAGGTGKRPPWLSMELLQLAREADLEEPADRSIETLERLRSHLESPAQASSRELPLPPRKQLEELQAELREYQQVGVRWLHWHLSSGSGALLADDMGLGKTLQAIAALPARTRGAPPSLVVCPTSVLPAWQAEFNRFRPHLKIQAYTGTGRKLPEPESDVDVVLTTYTLLRIDAQILSGHSWKVAILDEAQTIKNPDSQTSIAASSLRADARIALTGTPVENRVEDLWSLFRFLTPGLLGSRRNLPGPDAPPESFQEIRRTVRPFILRRLKRDVARELPPKTEAVLYGELGAAERSLYQSLLAASRTEVLKLLESGGSPLQALELLLRLRQACCHPALVPGADPATAGQSAKLQLLSETLAAAKEAGRRTLIFSQWTSLLDRVEQELPHWGVDFLRLDGSTRDRGGIVQRFQAPDGPQVLLLSLKAGGVGLTLTAADHVVLLDPWWNPAIEDQAGDRAHRIGQENPVLIQRLVMRDTIEERILELQGRKRALIEALLSDDRAPTGTVNPGAGQLTREDLLALLAP
jgi:superfamily II DNA or RNA helicase